MACSSVDGNESDVSVDYDNLEVENLTSEVK